MPSPRKSSDDTEHAIDEAKPEKVETECYVAESTTQEGEEIPSPANLGEGIAPVIVKTEFVKSDNKISSSEEVPLTKNIKVVSETVVPSIDITCTRPQEIKNATKHSTASDVSKDEQETKIKQTFEKSKNPVSEVPEKFLPGIKTDQLKSLEEIAMDKLSSKTETLEIESCKSEQLAETGTDINLSKADTVQEQIDSEVQISTVLDCPSNKTEFKIKECEISHDFQDYEQEEKIKPIMRMKEISGSENVAEQHKQQIPEETKSAADFNKIDPGQIKLPRDGNETKVKVCDSTPIPAHKSVSPTASDTSVQPSSIFEGISATSEKVVPFKKFSENFLNKMSIYEPLLHGSSNKISLKITKPDFPYAATRLKQIVVVKQGKFQVSLDVSRFDIDNIDLSIEDDKIHVCAKQEKETEFGQEYYLIQQIFKIPKHVNKDKFSACITENYRLFIEAPIRIPSK